jgi:hypothetical protein
MASDLVPPANLMGPDSVDPRLQHDDASEERIVNPELFDREHSALSIADSTSKHQRAPS